MDSDDLTRVLGVIAAIGLVIMLVVGRLGHRRSGRDRSQLRLLRVTAGILLGNTPAMLFGLCALVLFFAPIPFVAAWMGDMLKTHPDLGTGAAAGAACAIMVFCAAVATFMNLGIVACVFKQLRGGSPSVRDGLEAMTRHLFSVVGFALHAAVRGRSRRGDRTGISDLLVVPVLLKERLPRSEAVRRANELAEEGFESGSVETLGELVTLIVGLAAVLGPFLAIGAYVLPIFSESLLGREIQILPTGPDQYRVLFQLIALPVGAGLSFAAFSVTCQAVLVSAKYLVHAGTPEEKAAVLKRFPKDCL